MWWLHQLSIVLFRILNSDFLNVDVFTFFLISLVKYILCLNLFQYIAYFLSFLKKKKQIVINSFCRIKKLLISNKGSERWIWNAQIISNDQTREDERILLHRILILNKRENTCITKSYRFAFSFFIYCFS
jgi:hypothetical protein